MSLFFDTCSGTSPLLLWLCRLAQSDEIRCIGNVWEITPDCGNIGHRNNPGDGGAATQGDCSRMITKGGSFGSSQNDLRSARGVRIEKNRRERSIGLRLAVN